MPGAAAGAEDTESQGAAWDLQEAAPHGSPRAPVRQR